MNRILATTLAAVALLALLAPAGCAVDPGPGGPALNPHSTVADCEAGIIDQMRAAHAAGYPTPTWHPVGCTGIDDATVAKLWKQAEAVVAGQKTASPSPSPS